MAHEILGRFSRSFSPRIVEMFWKVVFLAVLHGVFLWCLTSSQACNSYGFICTSCTTLQLCTNGVPTSANLTCATDTYCNSTSSEYCVSTVCDSEPDAYYNCTTEGRFAVTSNCSQYVFCSNNTAGVLYPTLFECPNGTVFNPNSALCVLSSAYSCGNDSSTTTESSTTTTCTAAGRFSYTTDSTCQSYYYCYLESNGTYSLTNFTCPTTTVFNENTQKCVAPSAYTCPY